MGRGVLFRGGEQAADALGAALLGLFSADGPGGFEYFALAPGHDLDLLALRQGRDIGCR